VGLNSGSSLIDFCENDGREKGQLEGQKEMRRAAEAGTALETVDA
jgi:hypothetical protein